MATFISLDELETGGQSANYPRWLTDMYEVREFIGRVGKVDSSEIRVGQVTLRPKAKYPSHSHPAPEIYIQISGSVEWKVGAESKVIDTLTCVNIPSNTKHSMKNLSMINAELIYFWYAPGGDTNLLKHDATLEK